jgi:hypothetical protein
MAVPPELLERLRGLDESAEAVRESADELRSAATVQDARQAVEEHYNRLDRSVHGWLDTTEEIESRLREHAAEFAQDRDEVEIRLGGLALAHLSIAADVAVVAPLDGIASDEPVSADDQPPELPAHPDVSEKVLQQADLLETLSQPIEADHADDEPVADDASVELIDDVVKDIVDRAGEAGTSIFLGLGSLLTHGVQPLHGALQATPEFIQEAFEKGTRKIAGLVKLLVGRATKIMSSVLGGYRDAVLEFLGVTAISKVDSFGAQVISIIVDADEVRSRAAAALAGGPNRRRRLRRVRKTKSLHKKWVGPVPWLARGLGPLSLVMIGPIPAAAVAAVILLGWTVLLTGDQLDASGKVFPDLWAGVVRRAAGE